VEKTVGDKAFAGTLNETGMLELKVTAQADDSTIARIIHAVEQAQSERAPAQRFIDQFARIYTPVVLVLAVLTTLLMPLAFGWSWLDAVYRALVLLVIACPCALVISTPVTVVSALASAARHGVLVKGGRYLEQAGKLNIVAFDKTGTLTVGRPTMTALSMTSGSALVRSKPRWSPSRNRDRPPWYCSVIISLKRFSPSPTGPRHTVVKPWKN
tara:strand:+ start:5577 stop:6215 length:639 start_codon:yes stop_codon:yes gene_type:complete